jgi:hypothetical protein
VGVERQQVVLNNEICKGSSEHAKYHQRFDKEKDVKNVKGSDEDVVRQVKLILDNVTKYLGEESKVVEMFLVNSAKHLGTGITPERMKNWSNAMDGHFELQTQWMDISSSHFKIVQSC